MFKGKKGKPQFDIVTLANELLDRVSYDRNSSQSNQYCTVTVKSSLFDKSEAQSDNPLHGVIVSIEPKGTGEDYELFLKAAQRRLNLIYSCSCEHKGHRLDLSQNSRGNRLGISTSFNHRKNCLVRGHFLRLA